MKTFRNIIQEEVNQLLRDISPIEKELLNENEVQHLPASVQKWLKVSGVIGKEKARTVWLKQKFLMKLKPEQKRWYQANARQLFTTQQPAFVWTVDLKVAPFLRITGRDKFIDGKGEIQMKLNGIFNIGRNSGDKIDEGTLQRYLGETAWFPSAVVSPFITWEELERNSAKATLTYNGISGSGIFHFNDKGNFEKFSTWRYMKNTAGSKRREWIINARSHTTMNGITIPDKLDATWILEPGPWTWCNLEVTDLRYNNFENPLQMFG